MPILLPSAQPNSILVMQADQYVLTIQKQSTRFFSILAAALLFVALFVTDISYYPILPNLSRNRCPFKNEKSVNNTAYLL